jgi:large conductance mechanosensitive channel
MTKPKKSPTKQQKTKVAPVIESHAKGFIDFIRTQGIVGLAVGLAIGTQATEFVKSIVSSLITPLIDVLVGKDGLKGITWTVKLNGNTGVFTVGVLIDAALRFIAVALVVYFVVKGLKLDRLDKKNQ